jgi:hypothetical protein
MRSVLAAAITKLLQLQAAGGRLLVLGGRVIPFLTLGALQCHNFPHIQNPFSDRFSVVSGQFVRTIWEPRRFPRRVLAWQLITDY